MKTVWKFPLEITDQQTIHIPEEYELLHVEAQFGAPCIWALVESTANTIDVQIITHGTGHPVKPDLRYLGTYQARGGAFIGHVFTPMT